MAARSSTPVPGNTACSRAFGVAVALTAAILPGLVPGPVAVAASPTKAPASKGALERFTGPSGAKVLGQTVILNDVLPVPGKEVVVLTEFLTGQKGERDSINIVLDVLPGGGTKSDPPLATRDYLKEQGGPVAGGELSLVDLDWDGTNEVLVSFHHQESPGTVRVMMEVLHEAGASLKPIWSGLLRLDNSAASPAPPAGERERYSREIDFKKTGRTRGGMIVFQKKIFVAAGVALQPPGVVEESFPMADPR